MTSCHISSSPLDRRGLQASTQPTTFKVSKARTRVTAMSKPHSDSSMTTSRGVDAKKSCEALALDSDLKERNSWSCRRFCHRQARAKSFARPVFSIHMKKFENFLQKNCIVSCLKMTFSQKKLWSFFAEKCFRES